MKVNVLNEGYQMHQRQQHGDNYISGAAAMKLVCTNGDLVAPHTA